MPFFFTFGLFSPKVEFFANKIKAQADLQFVKIFGD